MKPFLKWAGSKYKIIDKIINVLPSGKRLIEPFVGSGSVFLNTNYEEYVCIDKNADLINLFKIIQAEGNNFIDYAKHFFIPNNNIEEQFYILRQEFNSTKDIYKKSALFIYLNRHCYNGLCRYNSSGGFNVPFGRYKSPLFPEFELKKFHDKSKAVQFICDDFTLVMDIARKNDVIYCDPPYIPLNDTANFTSYTKYGFDKQDQVNLANMAIELQSKNIPVIISNHDTDFAREIYIKAVCSSFEVQRFISSNINSRNKAPELLAIF
jgi:DNA adenine methylase